MRVIKKKNRAKPFFRFMPSIVLFLLIPFTLFLLGQTLEIRQRAQETAGIYVVSNAQHATAGQIFTLDVYVNANDTPVSVVQTNLAYPASKLDVIGIDTSNTPFDVESEYIVGNGLLRIGREASVPVTGNKHVITIRFKVKQDVEYTEITTTPGSIVLRSTDRQNILGSKVVVTPYLPPEIKEANAESSLWFKALSGIADFFNRLNPFKF